MTVAPSLPGSYEHLFHDTGLDCLVVDLRQSHYFAACLPRQFDIVVHYDQTRAVKPLERWSRHAIDPPETFPTGV